MRKIMYIMLNRNCFQAEFDKKKAVNSYLAIERWATPIICLATMFVLLLCSFFIGVTVEEGGIKQNTFHYFGENFRQVNQAFEGLGAEFQSQKSMLNQGLSVLRLVYSGN